MKFNKIALSTIVIISLCILIIVYFCFLAFSASFGYSSRGNAKNIGTGAFSSADAITIIIDPGHGGIDPGAVDNGLLEKDLNLIIATKVSDFLSVSGYKVVLTRNNDKLLGDGDTTRAKKVSDLQSRLEIIESIENCIFVSIHMNKFSSGSAWGLQTFYSSNNENSRLLAESIQSATRLLDVDNDRQIKLDDENIFILKKSTKPAVLVECGFISNASDALKLADGEYQNKLAYTIYNGIINYLGDYRK